MTRYRRRPVDVDAVRFTGDNWAEVIAFAQETDATPPLVPDPDSHALIVRMRSGGTRRCSAGDWLVRAAEGFYPCAADVFEAEYEELDVQPTQEVVNDETGKFWRLAATTYFERLPTDGGLRIWVQGNQVVLGAGSAESLLQWMDRSR